MSPRKAERVAESAAARCWARRLIQRLGLYRAAPVAGGGEVRVLTLRDNGAVIRGGPKDLFMLRLPERSASGYVWDLEQLREAGIAVVRDERVAPERAAVGGYVDRLITVNPAARRQGEMVLTERRPWEAAGQAIREFRVRYCLSGPESYTRAG